MDISTDFRPVSGRRAFIEALLRRWQTDRGDLIDDPNYGENLCNHLNDDMSPADVKVAQARAEAEARKDERTLSISSEAELTAEGELNMTFEVVDGDGPFTLTIAVTDVTVELLTVEE